MNVTSVLWSNEDSRLVLLTETQIDALNEVKYAIDSRNASVEVYLKLLRLNKNDQNTWECL